MDSEGIVLRRVRLLIRQISAGIPGDAKAQRKKVAARLGVSPSQLTKFETEGRQYVRSDSLESIVKAMRLSPSFFFDPALGPEPDHRQHIQAPRTPQPRKDHPLFGEFAAKWVRFGELSPEQIAQLRGLIDEGAELRDWTEMIPIATWLIEHPPRA